jgi:hypothetical protein
MKSRSNSLGVTVLVAVLSMLVTTVVVMRWAGVSILPHIPSHDEKQLGYYVMDGSKERELMTSLGNPNKPITEAEAAANGGKRAGSMNWIAVELKYVDPKGKVWIVPKGAPNDGASVPPLLESFVTGGLNTHARYAAIVHDHYCDLLAKPNPPAGVTYAEVHEMFYHAMRSSHVDARLAGIMYSAVEMFGPPKSRDLWTRVLENLTAEERRRLAKALHGEGTAAASPPLASGPEAVVVSASGQGSLAVTGAVPQRRTDPRIMAESWTMPGDAGLPRWTSAERMVVPTVPSPTVVAIDSDWNYTVMQSRPVNLVQPTGVVSAVTSAPKEADQFRKIVSGIEQAEAAPDLGKVKELIQENTQPVP